MSEHLYHVTFYRRLEGIAEDGLVPGRARSIGTSAYDAHAARGVFLSAGGGVIFWHSRAAEWAEHGSDDVLEDGLVPVVLRVSAAIFEPGELEADDIGTEDAKHDAWIVRLTIPPDEIEVYDGSEWLGVGDWESVNPELGVEVVEEDEESGQQIHGFLQRSPLLPELGDDDD